MMDEEESYPAKWVLLFARPFWGVCPEMTKTGPGLSSHKKNGKRNPTLF